jgi:hypothetical protein
MTNAISAPQSSKCMSFGKSPRHKDVAIAFPSGA